MMSVKMMKTKPAASNEIRSRSIRANRDHVSRGIRTPTRTVRPAPNCLRLRPGAAPTLPARKCALPPTPVTVIRTGYVRNYAAAELARDERWNNILFGLLAACGGLMAVICHWHLQAFAGKFSAVVEAARNLIG